MLSREKELFNIFNDMNRTISILVGLVEYFVLTLDDGEQKSSAQNLIKEIKKNTDVSQQNFILVLLGV